MQGLRTYVINLDGSIERFAAISQRLQEFGVEFERVPAVDGRQLDLTKIAEYDSSRAVRYMGRGLVGGEIGCYWSHLAVASRFLESDARYALVLEDDAFPLCNPIELLIKALPDLENFDPDWLLINIGNNKIKITTPISTYKAGSHTCKLVSAHYFPLTTSAIVWSRKGAKKFVENHSLIFAPVDNFLRYWLTREGHGYSFWPSPVITTDSNSLILTSKGNHRKNNERRWYYGFSKQKRLLEDKIIATFRKLLLRAKLAKHPRSCRGDTASAGKKLEHNLLAVARKGGED